MKFLNQKGTILLFAVAAITAIAVLGTGIYFMTSTSSFSGLGANDQNRAYQLALAGKDYALTKNLGDTATLYPSGRNFTFANGDKFRLVISGDTIISTGIVKEGTPYEAKRTITITQPGFSHQADVSFAKDIAAFAPGIKQTQAGYVNVDQTAAQISLGQHQASQFGAVWYSGNETRGNCQNGKCDFGTGFRAYFIFTLTKDPTHPTDTPHGFTFAFFNGSNNSNTAVGGDYGMPELLAYGGDSCTVRNWLGDCSNYLDGIGNGIQPPKIAIEFDAREQECGDVCNETSRCDGSRNHMSYTFWGNQTTLCKYENSPTYDDNKHGAGSVTDPTNAVANDTSDTIDYFTGYSKSPRWSSTWLYSTSVPAYAFRVEVQRSLVKNINNKYDYTIKTWIKNDCADIACSNHANTSFDNTKSSYPIAVPLDPPVLTRTIELDQNFHDKFNTFLFGWTAAAGSQSREKITLDKFKINFLN